MKSVDEFFGDVISMYTRAQAIADGELVEVTALPVGFWPAIPHVALTRSVSAEVDEWVDARCMNTPNADRGFERYVCITKLLRPAQDAISAACADGEELPIRRDFSCHPMLVNCSKPHMFSAHFGPGDDTTPVLTIMQVNED